MSSSYLLNLKINQLQQEVQGIGEAVGYFWNLSSSTGLTIDGGDTACNISAPGQNDTMWGSSNVARSGAFQLSATSADGYNTTVMYFGISKDITQTFPNPSSPSMAMCDWGVVLDNEASLNTTFLIQNGVRGNELNPVASGFAPMTILITYDGTTLKFFCNGIEITQYRQTVELAGGYYLVCGSFYGGQLNAITWSGTGGSSGGGGNENLQMVLNNGNDGGGLDITNVGNVTLNKYLTIGNTISNTSQIHMAYETGNVTTGHNWQIVASNNNTDPQIAFQLYNNNAIVREVLDIREDVIQTNVELGVAGSMYATSAVTLAQNTNLEFETLGEQSINMFSSNVDNLLNIVYSDAQQIETQLLQINKDNMTFTFGDVDFDNQTLPTLIVQGRYNDSNFIGTVVDTTINPVSIYISSSISNQTPKNISSGTPTSILKIDLSNYNLYNSFNSYINNISFQNDFASSNPNNPVTALFYLSGTQDADVDNTTPLYVGYTTQDLEASPNVNKSGVVLSNIFGNGKYNALYLNVKITSTNPCICQFSNFSINMFTQGQIMSNQTIVPTML